MGDTGKQILRMHLALLGFPMWLFRQVVYLPTKVMRFSYLKLSKCSLYFNFQINLNHCPKLYVLGNRNKNTNNIFINNLYDKSVIRFTYFIKYMF